MKRYLLFTLVSFPLVLVVFLSVYRWREEQRDLLLQRQAKVIQNDVHERFHLYLRGTSGARLIASTFWQQDQVNDREYQALAAQMISEFPEIHGVNELNKDGLITRVYPEATNLPAKGKVTQNLQMLRDSLKRGERFWFSHPFQLFQNERGFVCYLPLWRKNEHIGWLGVVISTHRFFDFFTRNEFGKNFDIEVTDKLTGESYLGEHSKSVHQGELLLQTSQLAEFGREISVSVWPKNKISHDKHPWITPTLLAFAFTLLMLLAFYAWDQRSLALRQLEDLNQLLRLTIHDTASSLTLIKGYIEIMKDNPALVPIERLSRHVSVVVDLLDQMKIVRKMSGDQASWKLEPLSLLPIVSEVSEIMAEKLRSKNILLDYNPEELAYAKVALNRGLFAHSVLGNLITNAIKFSPNGSTIAIRHRHRQEKQEHIIEVIDKGIGVAEKTKEMFEVGKMPQSEVGTNGEMGTGFGLLIAKQVMELHHGKMTIITPPEGGTVMRLSLPA